MLGAVDMAIGVMTRGHHVPLPKPVITMSRGLRDHRLTTAFLFGGVCLLHTLSWPQLARDRQRDSARRTHESAEKTPGLMCESRCSVNSPAADMLTTSARATSAR